MAILEKEASAMELKIHNMNLNPEPFAMIKAGCKTIELRLLDEKRQNICAGDTIVFTHTQTGETLSTTVLKLHKFRDFSELYENLPLLQCGYTTENIHSAHPSDMDKYYPPQVQEKYGVVGIEICT